MIEVENIDQATAIVEVIKAIKFKGLKDSLIK